MSIKFVCPHCQKPLQVKEDLAGKKVKCPGCQQVLDVPAGVVAATGAAAPAVSRPASAPAAAARPAVAVAPPPRVAAPPLPSQAATKAASETLKPTSADALAKAPPKPAAPAAGNHQAAPAKSPPAGVPTNNVAARPAPAPVNLAPPKAPPAPNAAPPTGNNAPPPPKAPPAAAPGVAAKVPEAAKPPAPVAKGVTPPTPVAKGVAPPPAPPAAKGPGPSAAAPVAKGVAPPPTTPVAKGVAPPPNMPASKATMPPTSVPVAKGVAPPPDVAEPPANGPAEAATRKLADAAKPAPPKPAKAAKKPDGPPVDEEALVAGLLADEPKPVEEEAAPEGVPITFKCFYCDEPITVASDLGGKQAPCPECRRIVKVPLPVKVEPKDWRKVERRGPSGARQDSEPEPEGAWGTATGMTKASAQSLRDAEALTTEPLTWGERSKRFFWIGTAVSVVGLLVWGVSILWMHYNQDSALRMARKYADDPKKAQELGPAEAGLMHLDMGQFYLRKDTAEDFEHGVEQFKNARMRFSALKSRPLECDLYLIELALAQLDLAGDNDERIRKVRMKWLTTQKEVQDTLQSLSSLEAKAEAAQLIMRKLLLKSKTMKDDEPVDADKLNATARAMALARSIMSGEREKAEILGVLGLELLNAGKTEQADDLAKEALKLYEANKKLPVAPPLLALLGKLDPEGKRAAELVPPGGVLSAEARAGYAMGLAYLGKWEEANNLAGAGANVDKQHQLQAYLAIAAVAAEQKPAEGAASLTKAIELVDGKTTKPWHLVQIIRLAGHPSGKTVALMDAVTKMLEDPRIPPDLKPRLEAELIRAVLAGSSKADLDRLKSEAAKKTAAHPQALELLARHGACCGAASAVQKSIATWDPEALRPIGYAGVALGLQDKELGTPR